MEAVEAVIGIIFAFGVALGYLVCKAQNAEERTAKLLLLEEIKEIVESKAKKD